MIRIRQLLKGTAAWILTVSMLAGCSLYGDPKPIVTGETISADSKWINSDIEDAIDENTPVNPKDDFYTAVNRDWLLSAKLTEDKDDISAFSVNTDVLRERKLGIIRGKEAENGTGKDLPNGISSSLLSHDQSLVKKFAQLSGDWENRNSLGVEPIRPYIDAIEKIRTMDDMTAYLLNGEGMNFTLDYPVEFSVETPINARDINTVMITPDAALTLGKPEEYSEISDTGLLRKMAGNLEVRYLLEKLGYGKNETDRIIRDSYRFEALLAECRKSSTEENYTDYFKEADNTFTFPELQRAEGSYPLTEILRHYGMDQSDRYTVTEPAYVKAVGKLYRQQNLILMKAYYTVHTLTEMIPLLDRTSYEKSKELENMLKAHKKEKPENPGSDPEREDKGKKTEEEKEAEILLDDFIGEYLPEPMDEIYVAKYCSSAQKEDILNIINDTITYYREMLNGEEWLTEETRNEAIAKLDNLCIRAVYPDHFTDFSGLSLDGCANLVEAVAAIRDFRLKLEREKVNQAVDRNEWDMEKISTTVANAYYLPSENSINIMAGILSDGFFYDSAADREKNLARIGTVIGHEITHAFDTVGYLFDKDGRYANWWSMKDQQTFLLRSGKLAKFYNMITPYPGAIAYSGSTVMGEATADMGGVKCMLALAAREPGFDYREFFTSYAEMWRHKNTYDMELRYAADVHPLSFLRSNVTLQQFDEFLQAFDIGPGDGMYLEPEKRVLVW